MRLILDPWSINLQQATLHHRPTPVSPLSRFPNATSCSDCPHSLHLPQALCLILHSRSWALPLLGLLKSASFSSSRWWPRGILYWQFREPLIVWTLRFYRGSFGSVPSSSSLLSRSPSKAWSSGGFPSLSIFRCVLGMGSALVERQAQHEPDRLKANRPDRLKKPTTEFTKEDWLKSWMSVS